MIMNYRLVMKRTVSTLAWLAPMLALFACGGGDDNGGGGGGGSSGGGATSNQFAYVANFDSNNVSIFGADANGALTSKGTVPAGSHPHMVTVDPQGRFVYVSNQDSDFLSGYRIDRSTGALTAVPGTLTVGPQTNAATFDSQGRFLYVINGLAASSIRAFTVNGDGTLTAVGTALPAGSRAHNVTVDPTNKFVFVASEDSNDTHWYTIQPDGSLAAGGSIAGSGGGADAVAAVSTFAYVANRGGLVQNFSVNQSTGALTPVASQPTISSGTTTHAITSDTPNHNFVYALNINSSNVNAYRVDKTTGALTAVTGQPFPTIGTNPEGIASSKDGFLYTANFATNNITRFLINNSTGELTQGQTFQNPAGATGPISIAVTGF